jgi:hypothetical protein
MVDAAVGGALLGMCLGVRVDHGGLIPQASPWHICRPLKLPRKRYMAAVALAMLHTEEKTKGQTVSILCCIDLVRPTGDD